MVEARTHLIIPDTQAKHGVPTDHLRWIGNYIVERKPDVVVHLGDHADMPSLSSWDQGKRDFEGRRYSTDIEAANQAFDILNAPLHAYNEHRRAMKEKKYKPRRVLILGNHEEKESIEKIKADRNDSEMTFMRVQVQGFERKIDDEIAVRLRGEDEIRKWFEQKFAMMMERLNFEERGQLDRERRIMQSLQEGLQALADIVRGVKEQMGLGLAEVHNLTLENITEVSKKNEVIRD
jgi:hypothetical protein